MKTKMFCRKAAKSNATMLSIAIAAGTADSA